MVDVITEIVINRPLSDVAAFAADPDNVPVWYVNIKSAEWKTLKPLAVGSQAAFVAHFLGRRLAYTYEFKELVPRQKLVMRTAEGPFPMKTTYSWTAIGHHTTGMTLQNTRSTGRLLKIVCPFYGPDDVQSQQQKSAEPEKKSRK